MINGVFPLNRAVSFSDHSAVFLTEHRAENLPSALLKLVPAIPTFSDTQLAYWRAAATLAHPNLIRLLEAGRCQIKGLQFLFVVMEYAEQTLAKLLAQRSLAPGTLQRAMRPILTSLGFLHQNQLVHGGLKPSNILLTNRRVKLASDTVRPSGECTASIAGASVYDPPEARDGSFTAAGDIWSLGVIMVEALTQRRPTWPDKRSETPVLPEALPGQFVDIIWQCLSRDPAKRPTVGDLEAQFGAPPKVSAAAAPAVGWHAAVPAAEYPVLSPPAPDAEPEAVAEAADLVPASLRIATEKFRPVAFGRQGTQRQFRAPLGAAVLAVSAVASVGGWASLRLPDAGYASAETPMIAQRARHAADDSATTPGAALAGTSGASGTWGPPGIPGTTLADSAQGARGSVSAPGGTSAQRGSAEVQTVVPPPSVLHEEAPDVPPSALKTVRGHIKFAVRVKVDSSGNVVDASLASHSPSKYFTRISLDTARKWKFVSADDQSRHWLLWFEFTRDSATSFQQRR